jgi:hypothetical protein
MIALAAAENFNNNILRGRFRQDPGLDIVRVQDAGLARLDDPTILAWVAEHGRILVSHDVSTLTGCAYDRVKAGQSMPGLIEVGPSVPIAAAIDDRLLIAHCGRPDEFEGRVLYLPLR